MTSTQRHNLTHDLANALRKAGHGLLAKAVIRETEPHHIAVYIRILINSVPDHKQERVAEYYNKGVGG